MKFFTNSLTIPRHTFFLTLLMIFCAGGFFGSILRFNEQRAPVLEVQGTVDKYNLYNQTVEILSKFSIEYPNLTTAQIEEGVVKGLVGALQDKHSQYFTPEEKEEFHEGLQGNFEGIGAAIEKHPLGVIVEQVIAGSPALEGGILAGDIIFNVQDESIEGLTAQQAVKKIRGISGTTVKLKIYRAQEKNPIEKIITRGKIIIPSILAKKEGNIGSITIAVFGENTAEDFKKEYTLLRKQNIQGLIIDLRNNGGGYLDSAQEILSEFVEKNNILVTTRSTNERENQTYISSGRTWKNIPTIVLINESSASASEITAGALQDYNLALIVGTKSYGKGSVQQAFPLLNSGELKITIAHWFTPKNRNIEKEKIIPDILIENTLEDIQKKNDRQKQVATEVLQEWIKNKSYQKTLLQFKK